MNHSIEAPKLKSAIDRVLICTTKEHSRFNLNAVRFTSNGETLKLEATDGCRVSVATVEVSLPHFQILVSADDCKTVRKMCRRKRDTITLAMTAQGLSVESSNGDKVVMHPLDPDSGEFPLLDHLLETETTGTIPVLEPSEFKRGVRLAQIARLDGERNFKTDAYGNLVRIISTPRKMTVFGKARNNQTQSVYKMDSDCRANGVSVAVNANFMLDLLKVMPKGKPFELAYWKNGTEGVAVRTENFTHLLCGITEKRGCVHA